METYFIFRAYLYCKAKDTVEYGIFNDIKLAKAAIEKHYPNVEWTDEFEFSPGIKTIIGDSDSLSKTEQLYIDISIMNKEY